MIFENSVAIVTGAAKGIGCATALAFAREGASVAAFDIDADPPACLRDAGERVYYVTVDVAREREVADAVAKVEQRFGGITILVNNAGIQRYATVTETSEEEWDHVLAVNLKSAFLCAKHALPAILRRGGGVVINVASVQSFVAQRGVAAYTTGKSALLGLTRSIAVDYAPSVRCVAVCPGTVDTPMFRKVLEQADDHEALLEECIAMHPLKRIATPAEVADLILFLCSTKASFITGQAVRIDGGIGIGIGGSIRPT